MGNDLMISRSVAALLADIVAVALQAAEWDAGCATLFESTAAAVAPATRNAASGVVLPERVQDTTLVCMSEERGTDGLIAAFNAREGADAMASAGRGKRSISSSLARCEARLHQPQCYDICDD